MKSNIKRLIAAGLVSVMAIGMTACGGNAPASNDAAAPAGEAQEAAEAPAAEAGGEKVLNFGCAMYSDGIVNALMDENGGWNAMRYGVTEGLFKFNDAMEVTPWLAESYEVNDEHTEWVIKLKDGIKFSSGADLTASAVKACFDRIKTEGPNGSAKPEKYLEYDAEVTADDAAGTITIKTTKPYANLMGQLCHPTMAIVDVENTTDYDNGVIGTGPYKIESFNGVGVGYTLVKNENYYEEVPYDKINLLYMGDNSAKAMALESGQVDLVENITNVADIAKFDESADYTVDITSGVRTGFSWMNFNGVLANKTLRQAILMGIDYDTIANSKTIGGLYKAGFSVLPSSLSYGYDKLNNPYAYDPEGAKKLLDDAGIVDTDGDGIRELDGQNINLRYVSYENRLLNDLSDAHTQFLTELGIGVTSEYGSSDDQWSKLVALDYDLSNNNWTTVGTGDPYAFLANWVTDAGYCAYSNPEYDALYAELGAEMDPEKRADIIFKLQQILVDDAVAIIDGYYSSSMIYSKNVGHAGIHTADFYWLSTEVVPAN